MQRGCLLLVLVADRFACPVNKMRLGASRTRHHFECIAVGRRTIRKPCLHFHARRGAAKEYGSHDSFIVARVELPPFNRTQGYCD